MPTRSAAFVSRCPGRRRHPQTRHLAALADSVSVQVRALGEDERIALFARLKDDKDNDLRGAGLLFLPAAKAVTLDPQSSPAQRRAAIAFLSAWTTQPIDEPHPRDVGFEGRVQLYRTLTDIPSPPNIAIAARGVVERAEQHK